MVVVAGLGVGGLEVLRLLERRQEDAVAESGVSVAVEELCGVPLERGELGVG